MARPSSIPRCSSKHAGGPRPNPGGPARMVGGVGGLGVRSTLYTKRSGSCDCEATGVNAGGPGVNAEFVYSTGGRPDCVRGAKSSVRPVESERGCDEHRHLASRHGAVRAVVSAAAAGGDSCRVKRLDKLELRTRRRNVAKRRG